MVKVSWKVVLKADNWRKYCIWLWFNGVSR